jgi:protein-histidine pros-kinase
VSSRRWGRQKSVIGEIVKQADEASSLSAFLQTHHEREKAGLARQLHDQLGGILTPAKMDPSWLEAHRVTIPVCAAPRAPCRTPRPGHRPQAAHHRGPAPVAHRPPGIRRGRAWYVDDTCGAAHIGHRVTIGKLERLPRTSRSRSTGGGRKRHQRHPPCEAGNFELVVGAPAPAFASRSATTAGIDDMEAARKRSHGLSGMTQRMSAIQGTLDIRSRRGEGTRVEAFLPIAA